MLHAIRLQNFRSFVDSGRVELADLNVFIGPNSAGKSVLMTAIEIAFASVRRQRDIREPLVLGDQASFASFDSIVRHAKGAAGVAKGRFSLTLEWRKGEREEPVSAEKEIPYWGRYFFRQRTETGAAYVDKVEYGSGSSESPPAAVVELKMRGGSTATDAAYRIAVPAALAKWAGTEEANFFLLAPWVGKPVKGKAAEQFSRLNTEFVRAIGPPFASTTWLDSVVVSPSRPVPQSIYVMDDPKMSPDDRKLISDLLGLWSEGADKIAPRQIVRNLETMMLAAEMKVQPIEGQQSPKMVEILISPHKKGPRVRLADVGYGVSQILPLLSKEAQLKDGNLIVYQPEVHLHPLAQSRLADVFAASIKRGNRAYIETHSEHLVMRLQALIASGDIEPDRVRVFCVEHDGDESSVRTMSFDDRGVPRERWPRGFLDTGLELARDLAARRQSMPVGKKHE